MQNRNSRPSLFSVGRRYANRIGEYEVLEINGDRMRVRYNDGREQLLSIETQTRISENITREAILVSPYPHNQMSRNDLFFRSLGFLAARATILEAFLPTHSVNGFNEDYMQLKGSRPRQGHTGLYFHPEGTDKWGSELRITFRASTDEIENLEFGPDVNVVNDPLNPGITYRINNNGFWWRLMAFGFDMGDSQNIHSIRAHIPPLFRDQFDIGYNNG